MTETENQQVIMRLVQCLNDRKPEVMDELFHEDAIIDWPQSRERIVGGENRRGVYGNFPGLPTITPRRVLAKGDLVTLEADMDYGDGNPLMGVFLFELRDGKIAHETGYWPAPFEAAEWRAPWVERT